LNTEKSVMVPELGYSLTRTLASRDLASLSSPGTQGKFNLLVLLLEGNGKILDYTRTFSS